MSSIAVLDTNVVLLPFTDGTDLEPELERLLGRPELVVPSSVLVELESLAYGGGKTGRAAKAAQQWVTRCRTEATKAAGDDGILDVARRLGAAVVTNDKVLQKECKASGLLVVASRGRGRMHRLDGSQ